MTVKIVEKLHPFISPHITRPLLNSKPQSMCYGGVIFKKKSPSTSEN